MGEKDTSRKARLLIVTVFIMAAVFVGFNYIKNIPTEASASDPASVENVPVMPVSPENIVALYYKTSCPYCHDAIKFIDSTLQAEFPTINIAKVNVSAIKGQEKDEFEKFAKKNNLKGVPVFRVGNDFISGFQLDESAPLYRDMLKKKLAAE